MTVRKSAYQVNGSIPDVWVLTLNRYQRDNLLAALQLIIEGGLPWGLLHTGDWTCEVKNMLGKKVPTRDGEYVSYNLDDDDYPNQLPATMNKNFQTYLERERYNISYRRAEE
jgi:hypothetical protein